MIMDDNKPEKPLSEFPQKEASTNPIFSDITYNQKKSNKKTVFIAVLAVIVLAAIGFVVLNLTGNAEKSEKTTPQDQNSTPTPSPTQAPKELNRSEWTLEVLNGSGATGLAKKIADQLQDLGYPVVKIANADRDDYQQSQILVENSRLDDVDLVVADLKDIIKIASFGGELKDSTASARIIIGQDSI